MRGVCCAGLMVLALLFAGRGGGPALAQTGDELDGLNRQVVELYQAARYGEAVPIAERALAVAEQRFGADHPDVVLPLNNLAYLYRHHQRYAAAEPLYRRVLAIRETALGPEHTDVGTALYNLAFLHALQGRYAEAEPLYGRALAIKEKALGPEHEEVATTLANMGLLYVRQGRYAEAEPLYRRTLAIREKALGPEHSDVGTALNGIAMLYVNQGRYSEAEPLYARALAIKEKALGREHEEVGTALDNIAVLYVYQGRYGEAEPLYRRALAIAEKALGPDHSKVGTTLSNLAFLYMSLGRYADAEPLYMRTLAIKEKALGGEHTDIATTLNNIALLYVYQGRDAEAEPLYSRAIAIKEKALGPEHHEVGTALNNLANLYEKHGRFADAEPLYRRTLAIKEKALGADHTEVGSALYNLGALYVRQDRYADAEPLYRRALEVKQRALGPDHPDVSTSLDGLAQLHFAREDWETAAAFAQRSVDVILRRSRRGIESLGQALTGRVESEAARARYTFLSLVKASHRLAQAAPARVRRLERGMFEVAQWAQASDAATALSQMAARQAKGDTELARLVRERQDLVAEWQSRDKALIAAVARPASERVAAIEQEQRDRLATIDARVADIDKALARDFPDYAALASPEPLGTSEVRRLLRRDEALVLFLDTPAWKPSPGETFIWVVTRTGSRWVRISLGTAALTERVQALRCGLDFAAWLGDGASRCAGLLKIGLDQAPDSRAPLPFDLAGAHELYKSLFGGIGDLVRGKHLLIVPSGSLTQLPFQVLVTQKPDASAKGPDFRRVAWLARRHAVTVLPAVTSLKALRRHAKTSRATKPLIGFANPLLEGPDRRYAQLAQAARNNQRCSEGTVQHVAGAFPARGGVRLLLGRAPLAELGDIRAQTPLPETADELCAVARNVRAGDDDIHLGARATERAVKQLSDRGALAAYRIVHFATHGTLAGEIAGGGEPGLILTPPAQASPEDDGYLSASEIAALKLDADWVILSACNTAAGGANNAQALSGLARAFFYAGARALLVSHWAVDSEATVKLITHALASMAADAKAGRSEALRRSMLALMEKGTPHEAHPAFWAPFVVVGEGAR